MGMQHGREDGAVPVGRIEHDGNGYVLAFDRQLDYPRAFVWDLLANPERVAQWLGELTPGWQQGKEYDLDLGLDPGGGRVSGTVLQLHPPTSLQLTWEDELGHESVIEWRVLDSDGGALVQFRAHAETPDFLAEGGAGWQVLLERFEDAAGGRGAEPEFPLPEAAPDAAARRAALRDAYAREFQVSPSMGSVHTVAGHPAVRFERLISASPEDLWTALTEPGQLGRWLGPTRLSLQTGGSIEINLGSDVVWGDLTKVVPDQALEYSWSSSSVPESWVHWHLQPERGSTWLRLTHVLQSAEARAALPALMAAWHQHLDALSVVLAGGQWHWSAHRNSALQEFYQRTVEEPAQLGG